MKKQLCRCFLFLALILFPSCENPENYSALINQINNFDYRQCLVHDDYFICKQREFLNKAIGIDETFEIKIEEVEGSGDFVLIISKEDFVEFYNLREVLLKINE